MVRTYGVGRCGEELRHGRTPGTAAGSSADGWTARAVSVAAGGPVGSDADRDCATKGVAASDDRKRKGDVQPRDLQVFRRSSGPLRSARPSSFGLRIAQRSASTGRGR